MTTAQKPAVKEIVHYFAEPNSKDQAFTGPYPAVIVAVSPEPKKEGDPPQTVDLEVWFSSDRTHTKTGVPQSDKPTKHHWCWPTDEILSGDEKR